MTRAAARIAAAALAVAGTGAGTALALVTGTTAWAGTSAPAAAGADGAGRAMSLSSPAFADNQPIPERFTCNGAGTRVPLAWKGLPAGTRALALEVVDPDAPVPGGFTHWLAWNIAPGKGGAGTLPPAAAVPRQGASGVGAATWIAPCPPSGVHRYVFTLVALRAPLALPAGADRAAFEKAVAAARPLATARLTGRYGKGAVRHAEPMNAEEPPPDGGA